MWGLHINKEPKGQIELKVSAAVKDLAEHTYATTPEEFETAFKNELKQIKPVNQYPPEHMFKCTVRNDKSIEIWSLKINGDFRQKLFTLSYNG